MLTLQDVSYIHPNNDLLFSHVNLHVQSGEKVALIGNNGTGKSTLLKIIAGSAEPYEGFVMSESQPYYMPQLVGLNEQQTVAQALGIDKKLKALHNILEGSFSGENYEQLEDDWTLEERCREALAEWNLGNLQLSTPMENLSGGQKTNVFLAGISLHQPSLVLLDEPSNHLDAQGRERLYRFVENTRNTLLTVSHDRKLLNLFDTVCELRKTGITVYGGNYDFYTEQRQLESQALSQDIHSTEKALKKAREKQRETLQRQQKLDSRGKGKQEKSGVARIMINTLRNNAENSTAKLKGIHAEKIGSISKKLQELRNARTDSDQMKFGFDHSNLHQGKNLFIAENINFCYEDGKAVWEEPLNLRITSGERIAIQGNNGSGKTTLIRVIMGSLLPQTGTVFVAENKSVYIDQDYSLLTNQLTIYEQAQRFNTRGFMEHDIKMRLDRFLFTQKDWNKPCETLSGGERMRLILCCLTIGNESPDLIILDEPTNNLDIQNIEILTNAINDYQGTLLVISHDESFLEQINMERSVKLNHSAIP